MRGQMWQINKLLRGQMVDKLINSYGDKGHINKLKW